MLSLRNPMLMGKLDQMQRTKQQLGRKQKQRCERFIIQSSIFYATMESSPLKCQVHDWSLYSFTER